MEWQLKTMADIAEPVNGIVDGPFGSNLKKSDYIDDSENGIPVLTTKNLHGDYSKDSVRYISKEKYEVIKRSTVYPGDILVAKIGSIGTCGIYPLSCKNALIPANLLKITVLPTVDRKYVYYYIQSKGFQEKIKAISTATAQPAFNVTKFRKLPIPTPPLPEQERIVARIEELFSQLDAGVETLKKTKAQLAVYRQAVLKEAFEGDLSAEWRTDHSDCSPARDYESIAIKDPTYKDTSGDENEIRLALPDNWIKLRMGDVFSVEVGATPSRRVPEYWNGAINWVSSGEVRFNRIFSTDERITEAGLANSSTNVQPAGTIMLAMIGEGKTRGQAAILEISAAHNQNTAAILVSATPCDPKYIYYFLQMNYENTRRVGSGNNQKALNKERVRALRFPFTSFAEQHVIVEAIESRLSVCDSIEQTVDAALQQAEAMRQSILKDAFEGKLT